MPTSGLAKSRVLGIVARREARYLPQYAESEAHVRQFGEESSPRLPNTSLNDRPEIHESKMSN